MVTEPGGTGVSEVFINLGFVEGKIFEGGLVVDGAGIAGQNKFHDGDGEVGIAGEDGGFDGGGAAIFGQEGRVDV